MTANMILEWHTCQLQIVGQLAVCPHVNANGQPCGFIMLASLTAGWMPATQQVLYPRDQLVAVAAPKPRVSDHAVLYQYSVTIEVFDDGVYAPETFVAENLADLCRQVTKHVEAVHPTLVPVVVTLNDAPPGRGQLRDGGTDVPIGAVSWTIARASR